MSDRLLASKARCRKQVPPRRAALRFGWVAGPWVELADGRRGKRLVPHPLEVRAVVGAVHMAAFADRSNADIGLFVPEVGVRDSRV
ncbi:hypothetical protein SAMN05660350_03037 [Geodermatophilus obscurus]|uniref:Uncharacterized protein n=1 Tax=Geodermatophilus obscurus TaxID=1861 RepID=A0A1M7UE50_9ACTN|nr:hypothetical protein [Geodermatophilus obscurus]SHN81216.1 hypothetical protein SAMN05660350_03037 [Geodermatophilus obscurus]